jgi:hypothetical protein
MISAMTPVRELETRALTLAEEARALKITDQQSYKTAAERLLAVVGLRREIEQHHAPLKKSAYDAWQQVIAAEKRLLDPVAEAEWIYKAGIAAYEAAQKRLEAERRAQAEAEARRAAEEARERELEQAEAEGADVEEIAAIANAPLPLVAAAPVESAFKTARNVTTAANWKGEMTSLGSLVKAIARGEANVNLVTPNEVAINQLARATRGTLEVPGIRFYSTTTVRVGRK